MKTLSKRLQRLETLFAPQADKEDDWGGMAGVRDEMLRGAARLGEPRCSEIRTDLDALGPAGLWNEAVRALLASPTGESAPLCWKGLARFVTYR